MSITTPGAGYFVVRAGSNHTVCSGTRHDCEAFIIQNGSVYGRQYQLRACTLIEGVVRESILPLPTSHHGSPVSSDGPWELIARI